MRKDGTEALTSGCSFFMSTYDKHPLRSLVRVQVVASASQDVIGILAMLSHCLLQNGTTYLYCQSRLIPSRQSTMSLCNTSQRLSPEEYMPSVDTKTKDLSTWYHLDLRSFFATKRVFALNNGFQQDSFFSTASPWMEALFHSRDIAAAPTTMASCLREACVVNDTC